MPLPRRVRQQAARIRYRAWQFFRALRPALHPEEIAMVRSRLSEAEFTLFLHADARDRRHSLDLYHLLREGGAVAGIPRSDDLELAALLHDVGKGRMAVWHRAVFVLLNALTPRLVPLVESPTGMTWRRSLWRLRRHADLGADLLAAAGTRPRVVEIVRAHTSTPPVDDEEIARFIRADDRV